MRWQSIRNSGGYTLGIRAGVLKLFGLNPFGQEGAWSQFSHQFNLPTTYQNWFGSWPTNLATLTSSFNGMNACAITEDGLAWYLGVDLSDNPGTSHDIMLNLSAITGSTFATHKCIGAAGYANVLFLVREDGTLWAMGDNSAGQFGDGTTTSVSNYIPVQVPGLTGVKQVVAGTSHVMVLLSNGTVKAWGMNDYGQCGDGTYTYRTTPVTVSGISNAIKIAAGEQFGLALLADGTVKAWGNGHNGSLGDGTATTRPSPVSVVGIGGTGVLKNVIDISAGASGSGGGHCLAVLNDGSGVGWGWNYYGQVGDGTFNNYRTSPVAIVGLPPVKTLIAGVGNSFAIATDCAAFGWGDDTDGQLGSGRWIGTLVLIHGYYAVARPVPVCLADAAPAALVSPGSTASHVQIVGANKRMAGFGRYTDGQIGNDEDARAPFTPTMQDDYITRVIHAAVAWRHSLAARDDGTSWSCGNNGSSECGDGTTIKRTKWVQVKGPGGSGFLTGVVEVACGGADADPLNPTILPAGSHSLFRKGDGTVWALGSNFYGECGDGTNTNRLYPVQVLDPSDPTGFLTGVIMIAAGEHWSMALKSDGTIRTWGYNGFGQLGQNNTTWSNVAVKVKGVGGSGYLDHIVAIAAGGVHALALQVVGPADADRTVFAWGNNAHGECGDESGSSTILAPVQVHGRDTNHDSHGNGVLTAVQAIAAGGSHSAAVISPVIGGVVEKYADITGFGQLTLRCPFIQTWSSLVTYPAGAYVTDGSDLFVALQQSTNKTTGDRAYWDVIYTIDVRFHVEGNGQHPNKGTRYTCEIHSIGGTNNTVITLATGTDYGGAINLSGTGDELPTSGAYAMIRFGTRVVVWGCGHDAQLGLGLGLEPSAVTFPTDSQYHGSTVIALTAGLTSTTSTRFGGSVWFAGANIGSDAYGIIGNGSEWTYAESPVLVCYRT